MHRWLVVLAVTSGCDYLLGLRHLGPRGPQNDTATVAGTYHQHWIENDSIGAPMPGMRGAPLAELSATVVLDDGSTREVTWLDDENFTFTIEATGDRYAFEVRSPTVDTVYELAVADPHLVERFPGRIDRDLVPPATTLALTVNNRPVGGTTPKDEIHTTGVWSRSAVDVMPDGKSISLDWATVVTDGVMGVLAVPDQLFYTHYASYPLGATTYIRLDAYAQHPNAALMPAATTSFTAAAAALPTAYCTRIKAAVDAESRRVEDLAGTATGFAYYAVNAVPMGGEFISSASFPLAYANPVASAPLDISPQYGNPYIGVEFFAQLNIAAALPGNAVMYSEVFASAPNTCGTPIVMPTGGVAIPTAATLDGVALDTDALAIDRAGDTFEVTWVPSPGSADYWIVGVYQVLGQALVPKVKIITLEPRATFASARLTAGKTYRLVIEAVLGSPDAPAGHFEAFDPNAVAHGVLDTPTFVPN